MPQCIWHPTLDSRVVLAHERADAQAIAGKVLGCAADDDDEAAAGFGWVCWLWWCSLRGLDLALISFASAFSVYARWSITPSTHSDLTYQQRYLQREQKKETHLSAAAA